MLDCAVEMKRFLEDVLGVKAVFYGEVKETQVPDGGLVIIMLPTGRSEPATVGGWILDESVEVVVELRLPATGSMVGSCYERMSDVYGKIVSALAAARYRVGCCQIAYVSRVAGVERMYNFCAARLTFSMRRFRLIA